MDKFQSGSNFGDDVLERQLPDNDLTLEEAADGQRNQVEKSGGFHYPVHLTRFFGRQPVIRPSKQTRWGPILVCQ